MIVKLIRLAYIIGFYFSGIWVIDTMLQSTLFAKLALMYALIKFIEFISKKSKDNGNN